MTVLHLFNRYRARGGEEIVVEEIGRALQEDHEVEEVFFSSTDWNVESIFSKILQPLRMVYNPAALKRVREVIRRRRPEVALVHNVFPVGSLWLYRLLEKEGVPVVQYIHNFRPFSVNGYCWADGRIARGGLSKNYREEIRAGAWQQSSVKTQIFAAVLFLGHWRGIWKGITTWVGISDFMSRTFIEAGIDEERVVTLRHAWQSKRIEGEKIVKEKKPKLLFLGRLSEQKGVRVLLEAWEKVEAATDQGVLMIGGTGPMEGELKEWMDRLKRLKFVGFVSGDEKEELLNSSTAMVVPSIWWEPLGLVVYEAYDHGIPVLAASSGGLTETVVAGKTGWLHEPGDVAKLTDDLLEIINEPEEGIRRGEAGREWLFQNAGYSEWKSGLNRILFEASEFSSKSP